MMHVFLVIVHIIVCFVLAIVVLLQSSKGGGLAGAFGGAGGMPQQILGSRGMTTLLHKLTIYLAVGFFVTSFLLFITDDSGAPTRSNVVRDAATSGELEVPFSTPAAGSRELPADSPPVQDTTGGSSEDESN